MYVHTFFYFHISIIELYEIFDINPKIIKYFRRDMIYWLKNNSTKSTYYMNLIILTI